MKTMLTVHIPGHGNEENAVDGAVNGPNGTAKGVGATSIM